MTSINHPHATFTQATFTHATFTHATFTRAKFTHATFTHAKFTHATFTHAKFTFSCATATVIAKQNKTILRIKTHSKQIWLQISATDSYLQISAD